MIVDALLRLSTRRHDPARAYDDRLAGSGRVPDIAVARTQDLSGKRMTRTPLLVVEVIPAGSRGVDR